MNTSWPFNWLVVHVWVPASISPCGEPVWSAPEPTWRMPCDPAKLYAPAETRTGSVVPSRIGSV